ncbi:MAG: hypothetical protein J6W14_06940, partial [Clostridia bacterium]|nr:hypothetical protein [Clostridia bacterium]
MKKRQLIGLLLLSALLLTSCGSSEPSAETTVENDISASADISDTAAEPEGERMLELIVDGQSVYKLLRAEEAISTTVSNVIALHKNIERYTSVRFNIATDLTRKGSEADNSQPEILIGETNRRATQELLADLPPHSYGIRVTEDKVVIVGTSENMTAHALYAFENQFLLNKEYTGKGYLRLPIGTEIIYTSESLDSFMTIMRSNQPIAAYVKNDRRLSERNGFTAAQGAATDGTYIYNVLKKKVGEVETDIIVKSLRSDFSEVLV